MDKHFVDVLVRVVNCHWERKQVALNASPSAVGSRYQLSPQLPTRNSAVYVISKSPHRKNFRGKDVTNYFFGLAIFLGVKESCRKPKRWNVKQFL